MSVFSRAYDYIADEISKRIQDRLVAVDKSVRYRSGKHPAQLKVTSGKPDDNLAVNFSGLIVDRGISSLLGEGIEFDLPGEDSTEEAKYITALMEANHQEILLQRAAMTAADAGTGYMKILPDGMIGKDQKVYPRLIVLNPAHVVMETLPEDKEVIIKYIIEYVVKLPKDEEKIVRETHSHTKGKIEEDGTQSENDYWTITREEREKGRWTLVSTDRWDYDFPAIVHWQNLPNPYEAEGEPDLTDDVIEVQDRINYVASNISKIIRLQAHFITYSTGLTGNQKVEIDPDKLLALPPNATVGQLQPIGDLPAAFNYLNGLRQALYDITRTVDVTSLQDKIGALTNFGLRVLYTDTLAKVSTKRALFGEALLELVRRLLVMAGHKNTDPGTIVWPEILPVNEDEQVKALKADKELGIVSRETIATKRGYDWEDEEARVDADKEAEDNYGASLLRNFEQGQERFK